MAATYPLDTTGLAASNRVSQEVHTLQRAASGNYLIVVPHLAPFFYRAGLKVEKRNADGTWSELVQDQDYYGALEFVDASRQLQTKVVGAISFLDVTLTGQVRVTYQTLGGSWTLDVPTLTAAVADLLHNPRLLSWETVMNVPLAFPAQPHSQRWEDTAGQDELLDALHTLTLAVALKRRALLTLQAELVPSASVLAVGTPGRRVRTPCDVRLLQVRFSLDTPSSAGAVGVDLRLADGTSILTAPLSIPAGSASATASVLAHADVLDDEKLVAVVTQAGTDARGLLLTLNYLPRAELDAESVGLPFKGSRRLLSFLGQS